MSMTGILDLVRGEAEAFTAIRRDLHRHPELPFGENRTSRIVADLLEGWGYQVERGLGGTGVVGQLRRGGPLLLVRHPLGGGLRARRAAAHRGHRAGGDP